MSPPIYSTTLDIKFTNFLKKIVDKSRIDSSSRGSYLAGNINEQINLNLDKSEEIEFTNEFYKYILLALEEFKQYPTGTDIKCSMGIPWINVQRAGEFNPLHNHAGELSVVAYIDIPECIALENVQPGIETNMPSYGKIDFSYTQENNLTTKYSHQPKTGELLIFPAWLLHTVYPFKSNVERISISFNVFDIEKFNAAMM
jgi:uncharacterized protein (TIGR02466 family)